MSGTSKTNPYAVPPPGCKPLTEIESRVVSLSRPGDDGVFKKCNTEDCNLPPASRNGGYCPYHKKRFVPKKGSPGSLCLGEEFMKKAKSRLCDCSEQLCQDIGYPNRGCFPFPSEPVHAEEWFVALNMPETTRHHVRTGQYEPAIAYWHFLPEHLKYKDKKWKLVPTAGYIDDEGKVWQCGTPPVANLEDFVRARQSGAKQSSRPSFSVASETGEGDNARIVEVQRSGDEANSRRTQHQAVSIQPPPPRVTHSRRERMEQETERESTDRDEESQMATRNNEVDPLTNREQEKEDEHFFFRGVDMFRGAIHESLLEVPRFSGFCISFTTVVVVLVFLICMTMYHYAWRCEIQVALVDGEFEAEYYEDKFEHPHYLCEAWGYTGAPEDGEGSFYTVPCLFRGLNCDDVSDRRCDGLLNGFQCDENIAQCHDFPSVSIVTKECESFTVALGASAAYVAYVQLVMVIIGYGLYLVLGKKEDKAQVKEKLTNLVSKSLEK